MTINKMGQSKEMLGYGMNVEKMSEVSKSYGYRMQHNGPASKEREISFDKIKTRKSSSVEKPKEDLEGSSRPPRASVIGYEQRNLENKRVIRSLNQVPNLPKARTSSKSQVFM